MTAKEKAEELFKKYVPLVPETHWMDRAKQCAIIAVDEILELIYSDESAIIVCSSYWEEVKQEINSL